MSRLLSLVWVVLVGCDAIQIQGDDGSTPFDIDVGGGDGDADDDLDPNCDVSHTEPNNAGPACVTETIQCGDTIQGTTTGGDELLSGAEYTSLFCAVVGDNDFIGPERVYAFTHPGNSEYVDIVLDEPCGGLELFLVAWEDEQSCPRQGASTRQCDSSGNTGTISVWDEEPRRYLLVVDGAVEGAPFELSVRCP